MNCHSLFQEVELIKKDLHYYNFIKSIIRLFSVRFQDFVSEIGTYKLLDICGTGGNGIVYRALNTEDQSQYALKIPYLSYYMIDLFNLSKEHMYDDPYVKIDEIAEFFDASTYEILVHPHTGRSIFYRIGEERAYIREFYSLEAMIDCENTVFLSDYGSFDLLSTTNRVPNRMRQIAYFVTPLFQGISLSQYFDRMEVSQSRWGESFKLLGKVIDIVENIHTQGVIHRDLHPGNFLYDEHTEDLNLIDFGSALTDLDRIQDTVGEKRGSKRFMAPEQFADPRKADERSDYFCIGGLLFYMLTAVSPFERNRKAATQPRSPVKNIKKPEGLSEKVYQKTIAFITRLMSFRPKDRFQTIEEIRNSWYEVMNAAGWGG